MKKHSTKLVMILSLFVLLSTTVSVFANITINDNDVMYIPNLEINKEVRMNEKRNGKWIYKKLVDCGYVPANALKLVRHGISNFDEIWIDPSNSYASTYGEHYGSVVTMPFVSNQGFNNDVSLMLLNSKNEIRIYTTSTIGWKNNYNAIVCIAFTKKQ